MKKRILAMILCVLMIVTMLPTWALAEETQEQAAPEEGIAEVQEAEAAVAEEPVQEPIEEPEPVIQETNAEAEETPTETEETADEESSTEPTVEESAPGVPDTPDSEEEAEPSGEANDGSENEPAETDVVEATQDETNTDPENEEELSVQTVEEAEEEEKVRVTFELDPPDATLTVYTLDENEEKQIIYPEEDGTYLLLPGEYYYDAECDGYESQIGTVILVDKRSEETVIDVTLYDKRKKENKVSVHFICDPVDLNLSVYEQERDDFVEVLPEPTGGYKLHAGMRYFFSALHPDYESAQMIEFFVPGDRAKINISLSAGLKDYMAAEVNEEGIETQAIAPAGAGARVMEGGKRDFKWPVPSSFGLSSCFKDGRNHDAIDIAGASAGATVIASYSGTVCEVGYSGGYGNYVIIRHNYILNNGTTKTLYSKYNHLQSYDVSNGQTVTVGKRIAGVGNSGGDYPVHLDFQIMTGQNWGNYNYHNISIDPYVNELLELPNNLYIASTADCCGVGPTGCCCKKYIDYIRNEIYSTPTVTSYYLDLNGYLDGQAADNLGDYGTADVYIKRPDATSYSLDATNVTDYYKQWPTGTSYEIVGRASNGYIYNGAHSSGAAASGVIGSSDVRVALSYSTAYSIKYKCKSVEIEKTVTKGNYTVEPSYETLSGYYFTGWSYSPNSTMFDVRPGETISVSGNVTLYPVYISHAEATSGESVLIYDIGDFPAEGYNITTTSKDVSVTTTESDWSAWSAWSTTAVSGSSTVQVETRTAYGWYYFECPNCHAHMHGYGTCWTWCGGCGATTTSSGWHSTYDPTNWSAAKDWYGTGKYYTSINGQTWFKWEDGGTQTQYRSRRLVTNTATTNKTYTAYVIRPAVGYTITFDANGGAGAPGVQTKYEGQTLTLSTIVPTRACHVFLGWASSNTATTAQYQPGGSFSANVNTILYAVWAEGTISEWGTTKPTGVDESLIETKTQYRYRDKETTTGTSSSMSGWTLESSEQVLGDWGSWSGWSTTAVTANDSRQVETRTAYGWYYFECPNCHAHMHGYGTCWTWCGGCGATTTSDGWHAMYDPTNWSVAQDWHGTGKYYATINGATWFKWEDGGTQTQYRYRTRTQSTVYTFYRWGSWSNWSDTVYTANDNRQVETRKMYRYVQAGSEVHNWDNGVVTKVATCTEKGIKTYTCTKCGETRTEEIAALGHTWGAPTYSWSSDNRTVIATRICSRDKTHVESETVNTVPSVSKEATCMAMGETTYTATFTNSAFAGQSKTLADIPALGHSWGEWTVTKAATCTEKGIETRTCTHDSNHKETKEIAALGHNFVNGVCTRVGCGERDPGYAVDTTGKLIVSAAKGRMGDEVTVNVSIAENPGIMVLNLGLDYDRTRLSYVGFEDAGFTDWTVASNAVWLGNSNSNFNGVILKLKFKIVDNAPEGDAYVTVTCSDGDMADQNETVYIPSIQAGKVTVYITIPGDINGDGKVNALDLVRLKRAIAGENVELVGSGDTTGDGKVNALDLVRLKRAIAGENVELH